MLFYFINLIIVVLFSLLWCVFYYNYISPASKLVCPSSGILSVQKRHQGLKNKRWDFQRSYKSLKTAVILRPDLTNFFTVSGNLLPDLQRKLRYLQTDLHFLRKALTKVEKKSEFARKLTKIVQVTGLAFKQLYFVSGFKFFFGSKI